MYHSDYLTGVGTPVRLSCTDHVCGDVAPVPGRLVTDFIVKEAHLSFLQVVDSPPLSM